MSTINQESNKEFIGTQRGIREILKTIREGTRMSKIQLRFAMTVAILLLIVLFVTMIIAGERANNTVLVNEEAELLTDATTAERIFSADGKTLAFQEGYTWSGEGPRYILNERMTTSKPYWLTLSTESEIAEYEQVLGEGHKKITGADAPVIEFLEKQGEVQHYLDHVYGLVDPTVDKYIERGFANLMVSFGCTGGQHRSLYCANRLAEHLKEKYSDRISIVLEHREQEIKKEI